MKRSLATAGRWAAVASLVATVSISAPALAASPTSAASAPACKALSSKGLKAVLREVMDRSTTQRTPLPSKVLFGRCGTRYYAAAWFNFPRTGFTDQPERFTRPRGGRWRLMGDTGGPVLPGIPRDLRRAWGLP